MCLTVTLAPSVVLAGGPKYVAGTSFFNPAVLGQPVHWANGQVNYYVDQGPLNSSVTNQQATAMVDAAAALWSNVTTAGVTGAMMGGVLAASAMLGRNMMRVVTKGVTPASRPAAS